MTKYEIQINTHPSESGTPREVDTALLEGAAQRCGVRILSPLTEHGRKMGIVVEAADVDNVHDFRDALREGRVVHGPERRDVISSIDAYEPAIRGRVVAYIEFSKAQDEDEEWSA